MIVKEIGLSENQEMLHQILEQHQIERTGHKSEKSDMVSFCLTINHEYAGGVVAKKTGNRLHISLLGVSPQHRHKGYGETLIKRMEQEARNNNCRHITVNTQDFQGLSFYQRLGFHIFGEIKDCPYEGTTKYYLLKDLTEEKS